MKIIYINLLNICIVFLNYLRYHTHNLQNLEKKTSYMVISLDKKFIKNEHHQNPALEALINNIDIKILGYGLKNAYSSQEFILSAFLMLYCLEDNHFEANHEEHPLILNPGNVYLFEPFKTFKPNKEQTKADSPKYFFIYFTLTPIASYLIFKKSAFRLRLNQLKQSSTVAKIKQQLQAILRAGIADTPLNNYFLQSTVRSIIAYILYSQQTSDRYLPPPLSKEMHLVNQVFSYTELHMDEPISISQLASHLSVSQSNLNRTFNSFLNETPIQAITKYKLDMALVMLKKGLTVKEAALKLGFYSPFHFSYVFKKYMGKSPKAYIKST